MDKQVSESFEELFNDWTEWYAYYLKTYCDSPTNIEVHNFLEGTFRKKLGTFTSHTREQGLKRHRDNKREADNE